MVRHPIIATIHHKDKYIDVKMDFRIKMIPRVMFHCGGCKTEETIKNYIGFIRDRESMNFMEYQKETRSFVGPLKKKSVWKVNWITVKPVIKHLFAKNKDIPIDYVTRSMELKKCPRCDKETKITRKDKWLYKIYWSPSNEHYFIDLFRLVRRYVSNYPKSSGWPMQWFFYVEKISDVRKRMANREKSVTFKRVTKKQLKDNYTKYLKERVARAI